MKAKKTLVTALVGAYSLLLSCSGALAWQTNINGTANSYDWANAVAVDAAGNVVAAGATYNGSSDYDFTVVKFDGVSGAELWRQVINGTADSYDSAYAVAVDAAGNVVAAGYTYNSGTFGDFTVVKLDGVSGAELWRQDINGTADSYDSAYAVAVDAAGNVVAAGTTNGTYAYCDDDYCYDFVSDFTVVKFDGVSGQELWRKEINGTANGYNDAYAIAVDAAGNVVAAGATENTGTGYDFTVIKFDGTTGAELWRELIDSVYGWANAVAVDAAGNVITAGTTYNSGTGYDFTVVKFDGVSGAELWRQVISSTANCCGGAAYAVAVDTAGNVVAAGYTSNNGSLTDFTVIKFDGVSGAELWRQVINGTANWYDSAYAVAVDAAGNVVAAGSTNRTYAYCDDDYCYDFVSDFTVVKFDGASGVELWRQVINSTVSCCDGALAVAVDAAGNVVAAGVTYNTGTSGDFTVIKLSGISITPTFNLGVIKSGNGTGTVTSNPAGINCGGDCSENYNVDTVVTLTPTADADSVFSGWSGDPDCTDGVVTMDVDKNCIATFSKRLNVTAANGGEIWHIGKKKTIQWTSIGINGNVKIELSRNGGSTWKTLFTNTANDGSQSWKVTKSATTQARIRICSVSSPTICDTSDANFTIQ